MRTKKAFYNLIANLALQVINALFGLILPRLFISVYGSAINGLIMSIRLFVYFLNIVEAGIGLSSITALLKPLAANDKQTTNGILSAAKILYIRAGYIFTSLIAVLSIIYPLIVKDEISFKTAFFLVLIFGLSGTVDFFVIGKYRVLLTADQKGYVLTNIQIVGTIFNAISYIILIKSGWDLLLVNSISSLLFASRSIFLILYVKRAYPLAKFNNIPHTSALKKRWDVLIHQLAGVFIFNTPVMIIAVFLGLKEVSIYTTFNTIFSGLTMLVTSFSSALFAGMGDLLVRDEKHKAKEVFHIFEFVYYAMIAWTYTTAYVLIMPFIRIYTHGFQDANYIQPVLAILFILVGVINNIRIPSYTLFTSAGHFKETRFGAIAEVIVNLAASLLLVQLLGVNGVLLGGVISAAYRTTDCILYSSRKLLKTSLKITFQKLMLNLTFSIIAILPFQLFFHLSPNNIFEWFLTAIIVALWNLSVLLIGNMMFDRKMCSSLLEKVKVVLSRRSKVKLEI